MWHSRPDSSQLGASWHTLVRNFFHKLDRRVRLSFLISIVFMVGCATNTNSTSQGVSGLQAVYGDGSTVWGNDFQQFFENGEVRLSSGGPSKAWNWGVKRSQAESYYSVGEWSALAELVAENAYESDLGYFYLGRAAEELGHYDAALIYFDFATVSNPCAGLIDVCDGIDVELEIQLARNRIARDLSREQRMVRADELMALWDEQFIQVDGLEIKIRTLSPEWLCEHGGITRIEVAGVINPDVSFAVGRILEKAPACQKVNSTTELPPLVFLESEGGKLADGYSLGRSLRSFGASTAVGAQKECASACAVAYLGGKARYIAPTGQLLFHSPYYFSDDDQTTPNCDIGDVAVSQLSDYYSEMMGAPLASTLLDRTLSYCSEQEGWTVRGAYGAQLFGIATY